MGAHDRERGVNGGSMCPEGGGGVNGGSTCQGEGGEWWEYVPGRGG